MFHAFGPQKGWLNFHAFTFTMLWFYGPKMNNSFTFLECINFDTLFLSLSLYKRLFNLDIGLEEHEKPIHDDKHVGQTGEWAI